MPTADWAEKYLYLPEEGANVPGPYRLKYAPYLYGIFAALDDPRILEVVMMKASQIGWTYALLAYLFKRMHVDPGPMIVMFSNDTAGQLFNDEKFDPTLKVTETVSDLLTKNRTMFKKFPSGFLKFVGSNSLTSVQSTPASLVVVEEPDSANENLKGQGDSVQQLYERTKRMRNAKRILGGTPSVEGVSRVAKHIAISDKCVLPIECHDCGGNHVLDYDFVDYHKDAKKDHPVFGKARPDTAVYVCPLCGSAWDDYQRKENIRNTVDLAMQKGDPLCGWTPTAEFSGTRGFMELGEVYSCLPGAGMSGLVKDYLQAEHEAANGSEEKKIVFINQKRGRTYSYQGDEETADALREKALDYKELECPTGGLLVTAGIDIQHDRLAIIIRAWGRDEESWLLFWGEIPAAESCLHKTDAVWDALDDLIFQSIPHGSGGKIAVEAVTIDCSDGATQDAGYSWVRSRQKKYRNVLVMAGKGSSVDPQIFEPPTAKRLVDHKLKKNYRKPTKADKYGIKLYIIGVIKAKDWVSSRLKLTGMGPSRFHSYKDVRDDYYEQVTSEVKIPKKGALVWTKKPGVRNEGGDCENYALHAARAKLVHLLTPKQWDARESRLFSLVVKKQDKPKTNKPKPSGGGRPNESGGGSFI